MIEMRAAHFAVGRSRSARTFRRRRRGPPLLVRPLVDPLVCWSVCWLRSRFFVLLGATNALYMALFKKLLTFEIETHGFRRFAQFSVIGREIYL